MSTRPPPTSNLDDAWEALEPYALNLHKDFGNELLAKISWRKAGGMNKAFFNDADAGSVSKLNVSCIARVQDAEPFLAAADGGYSGPNGRTGTLQYEASFKDLRLAFVCEGPTVADRAMGVALEPTWPIVMANINKLIQAKLTRNAAAPQTFVSGDKLSFKVSHKLFKVPKQTNSGVAASSSSDTAPSENNAEPEASTATTEGADLDQDENAIDVSANEMFTLDKWPFPEDSAADKARKKGDLPAGTTLVPMPVYDYSFDEKEDGHIILPTQYEKRLRGALVLCTFTLAHFYKKSTNTDVFTANMSRIDVLRPRLSTNTMSPVKKRRTHV